MSARVIAIHAHAPAKPAPGQACNGCGVCCLAEPCPLGMLLSLKRQGPCDMLRWDASQRRYVCGAVAGRSGAWAALARRWISAGRGCDSDAEVGAA
jgi:Fe-S-cluster-containing hydrogenase component 2